VSEFPANRKLSSSLLRAIAFQKLESAGNLLWKLSRKNHSPISTRLGQRDSEQWIQIVYLTL
jgi:hypothetical protein